MLVSFFTDNAEGASMDWAKKVMGIKWSYSLELYPDSRNSFGDLGFVVPASEIKNVGEEVWAGVQIVAEKLIETNF